MKKYFSIATLIVGMILVGCNNSSNAKAAGDGNLTSDPVAVAESNAKSSDEKGSVKLTKELFLKQVMNYEKNTQEWVYEGTKPCLIDFYADWCGPCKIAAPILEELAIEFKDQIIVYKIDTQVEQELAGVFGIQSIPAFLFVPLDGRPTMSNGIARTPAETKEMFRKMINEILLAKASE